MAYLEFLETDASTGEFGILKVRMKVQTAYQVAQFVGPVPQLFPR